MRCYSYLTTAIHPRLEGFNKAVGKERAECGLEEWLVANILTETRQPQLRFGSGHVKGGIKDQRAFGSGI